jgi:hypothetical protein
MRLVHRALRTKVLGVAKAVGLDVDRLKVDMQAPDISARLGKNIALAQTLASASAVLRVFAVGDKVFITGRPI